MDEDKLDIFQLLERLDGEPTTANQAMRALERRSWKGRIEPAAQPEVVRVLIGVIRRPLPDEPHLYEFHMVKAQAADVLGRLGRDARVALPTLFDFWQEYRNQVPMECETSAESAIALIVLHDEGIREAIMRLVAQDETKGER